MLRWCPSPTFRGLLNREGTPHSSSPSFSVFRHQRLEHTPTHVARARMAAVCSSARLSSSASMWQRRLRRHSLPPPPPPTWLGSQRLSCQFGQGLCSVGDHQRLLSIRCISLLLPALPPPSPPVGISPPPLRSFHVNTHSSLIPTPHMTPDIHAKILRRKSRLLGLVSLRRF